MKHITLLLIVSIFLTGCINNKNTSVNVDNEARILTQVGNQKIINKYDGVIVDIADNKVVVKNKHDGSITEYQGFKLMKII